LLQSRVEGPIPFQHGPSCHFSPSTDFNWRRKGIDTGASSGEVHVVN
jgi:hypothetical protein